MIFSLGRVVMLKNILGSLMELKVKLVGQTRQTRYTSRQKAVTQQGRDQIKRIRAKGLSLPIFTL